MSESIVPTDECECFRNSINSFLRHKKKRLEKKHGTLPAAHQESCKHAISISNHAIHILKTLYVKRNSLLTGIAAFETLCQECINAVKRIVNDGNTTKLRNMVQNVLTHLFVQYIHLRDGFVLLTSGECRHEADSKLAKNDKVFPSRLSSLCKRKDGYTTLFSSKLGYSGYGWDEFHNEEVGVRRRLLDKLRTCGMYPKKMTADTEAKFIDGGSAPRAREAIWEKLIEDGAEIFENAFDRHENNMKELQRCLERTRCDFVSRMEKVLSPFGSIRLMMVTEDKFERLELKNASALGLSAFCIQRQGDAFRGNDRRGALPSNINIREWAKIVELPSHVKDPKSDNVFVSNSGAPLKGTKRKRVVIDDSDEECQNEEHNVKKNGGKCLKVTVKTSVDKGSTTSSSIHTIKQRLGVNVDDLERGREGIEAEEEGTKEAAYVDEVGELLALAHSHINMPAYSEELSDLVQLIKQEEENVHLFKSICKKKNREDDESWDVRESLRYSLMTLGNLYLEYHSLVQNNQDYQVLSKAQRYFEESISVVRQLQQMNKPTRENDREFKLRERALLLCRGRAYTNLGKTYFEQSEMILERKDGKSGNRKEYVTRLTSAARYLKRAETDARSLKVQAVMNDVDTGTYLHRFDASLLLSLTCRFQGYVFLRMSKERESIDALKRACGIFGGDSTIKPIQGEDEIRVEAMVWLLLEQYDGACSLIQICTSLFDLSVRENESVDWNDNILDTLRITFDKATKLSGILHNDVDYSSTIKENVLQHGIRTVDEILKLKAETLKRLSDRTSRGSTLGIKNLSVTGLPRNDLFRNDNIPPRDLSVSERIVIDYSQRKNHPSTLNIRRKDKESTESSPFDSFNFESAMTEETSLIDGNFMLESSPAQYRKWGDELLRDRGIGDGTYPSCEPARPPEMIRDMEKLGFD